MQRPNDYNSLKKRKMVPKSNTDNMSNDDAHDNDDVTTAVVVRVEPTSSTSSKSSLSSASSKSSLLSSDDDDDDSANNKQYDSKRRCNDDQHNDDDEHYPQHELLEQQQEKQKQEQQQQQQQQQKLQKGQKKKHQRKQQQQVEDDEEQIRPDVINDYIPQYLRQFIQPYHGDFCFSPIFHPILISQLMIEGFLTMAGPGYLLPKLHEYRCVIDLHKDTFHISKSTRKKANKFYITINKAFHDVVTGCHEQHGRTCWLYPPLVEAFQCIHDQCQSNTSSYSYVTKIIDDEQQQQLSSSISRPCHLRFYSIEIWNKETNELVGGELGYTVGSIYTSLTGFSAEDSAGSVQLATLGSLLIQQHFTMWDLGMEMEYKKNLGSKLIPRKDFVNIVHTVREQYGHLILKEPTEPNNTTCRDIIQGNMLRSNPDTEHEVIVI